MGHAFGAILRELRLKAGIGLRRFAEMVDMEPSNLSALEHGRRNPPADPEKIKELADALGLADHSEPMERFLNAARKAGDLPADVKHLAKRKLIPTLLRTIDNKKLSDSQLKALIKEIAALEGE